MINHARTLLLNGNDTTDPAPWDRYFPEEFKPLALPTYLEGIRKLLVGTDGWWDRTYRVELLLEVLNSPRYEGKFAWMDARVTPPLITPFLYSEPDVSVARVAALNPDVYVTYLKKSGAVTVPIKRTWQVRGSGGELFTVNTNGRAATIRAYYSSENSGWILPIAGDFELLFSGFGTAEDIWNVRAYTKPQNTFAAYPILVDSLPAEWSYPMFSVGSPSENPITEYFRWYKTCVHAEDRVVAVLLSYLLKATLLLG